MATLKNALGQLRKIVVLLLVAVAPIVALGQDPFQTQVRPTDPLTADEQRAAFRLPPNFEIQLVASEPDISKPMNLAFDTRGRLWLTESSEYPYAAPIDRPGRDAVKILEDTDGDGRADKIITFADGLNIPIGLYPFENGCIVFSIPNIWLLEDTDGDDRADRRTKLYGPMGYERDTHGLNNAFRRGFDGWLYACHGFNNDTRVAGADGHEVHMQSGNVYRMRLDGARIEQFTWGQVNPFGMTVDALGNLFTADCHSKPIYQLLRNGRYPSFGKPHDGLGFVPPMMDHLHGSTAIAGVAYYADERFPEAYRGNFFSGNVMTSRVNRNSIKSYGSTLKAIEEPDFVSTSDPWFRPVDVRMGPDGALYIADFYNRIIGHYEVPLDHPGRDRHRGRVWRVVYRGDDAAETPTLQATSTADADSEALLERLAGSNLTARMLAMNQFCDRVTDENRAGMVRAAKRVYLESDQAIQRAHCLWILKRLGCDMEDLLNTALEDKSEVVSVHAHRILAETPELTDGQKQKVTEHLAAEHPLTRRISAEVLSIHSYPKSVPALVAAMNQTSESDPLLRYMLRRALHYQLHTFAGQESLASIDQLGDVAAEVTQVMLAVPTAAAAEFLMEQVKSGRMEGSGQTVAALRHVATHGASDRMADLIDVCQQQFDSQPGPQVQLIQLIRQSFDEAGRESPPALQVWSTTLASELLESSRADVGLWRNVPIPNRTRADNPWLLESRRCADGQVGERFVSSLPAGEQATGRLVSAEFAAPEQLSFYCAGHIGHPDRPVVALNEVRLVDVESGQVVRRANPPRNDTAQPIRWDLGDLVGRRCRLEIVDGDERGAYAWISVGRIEPNVAPFPTTSPRVLGERIVQACELIRATKEAELLDSLTELVDQAELDADSLAAIIQTLQEFSGDPLLATMVVAIRQPDLTLAQRAALRTAYRSRSPDDLQRALTEILNTVPTNAQRALAEVMVRSSLGREILFAEVDQGRVPARLLAGDAMEQLIVATASRREQEQWQRLIADLPAVDEQVLSLIDAHRQRIARRPGDGVNGAKIFTDNCANCHKIGNEGAEIGPQLDGIGNRGLARVLEDTLDPNRNVDVAFRSVTVVTVDGTVHVGLQRREEGEAIVFADREGKEFRILADDIEELVPSEISLMPETIARELPPEQLVDLVTYLLEQRQDSGE